MSFCVVEIGVLSVNNFLHQISKKKVVRFTFVVLVEKRLLQHITITRLFKYTENFTIKKWKFSDKKISYFIHISATRRF